MLNSCGTLPKIYIHPKKRTLKNPQFGLQHTYKNPNETYLHVPDSKQGCEVLPDLQETEQDMPLDFSKKKLDEIPKNVEKYEAISPASSESTGYPSEEESRDSEMNGLIRHLVPTVRGLVEKGYLIKQPHFLNQELEHLREKRAAQVMRQRKNLTMLSSYEEYVKKLTKSAAVPIMPSVVPALDQSPAPLPKANSIPYVQRNIASLSVEVSQSLVTAESVRPSEPELHENKSVDNSKLLSNQRFNNVQTHGHLHALLSKDIESPLGSTPNGKLESIDVSKENIEQPDELKGNVKHSPPSSPTSYPPARESIETLKQIVRENTNDSMQDIQLRNSFSQYMSRLRLDSCMSLGYNPVGLNMNKCALSSNLGTWPMIAPHINGGFLGHPMPMVSGLPFLHTNNHILDDYSGDNLLTNRWLTQHKLNVDRSSENSNLFKKLAPDIISRNCAQGLLNSNELVHGVAVQNQDLVSSNANNDTSLSCEQRSNNEVSPRGNDFQTSSPSTSPVNDSNSVSDANMEDGVHDFIQDNQPSSSTEHPEATAGPSNGRKRCRPVPNEEKDENYRQKRDKNNRAAKRSRDNRRERNNQVTVFARRLESKLNMQEQMILQLQNQLALVNKSLLEASATLEESRCKLAYFSSDFSNGQLCNTCTERLSTISNNSTYHKLASERTNQ